jgi:phage shock protein PspC (stress-responsive transcriptional regulator)
MISIIGKPEDFDHNEPETAPPVYTSQRRRMYRNPDDTIISGVCGGLGAYLNTDPVIFRILFVLFTLFFGSGFLVYIVLWIALPSANTDARKREMYGNDYHSARPQTSQPDGTYSTSAQAYNAGYNNTSRVGNAFNEVFRAIGRVLYIILRIFLIIIGVMFVLTGFLTILSFVMIFVFKLPNAFTTHGFDMTLTYFPDFLNHIVSPVSAPWIIALTTIVVLLPMIALIYWGIKMIFWFKAKDGLVSLIGLVVWVMAVTALSILLFNEGISFAESSGTTFRSTFPNTPDTLYIVSDKKIDDLKYDKAFSLPDEEYGVYMSDSTDKLFITARLKLNLSEENEAAVEIRKRSSGRTKTDAIRKSESLIYEYRMSSDTLYLDEYFLLPSGQRWSNDFVTVNLILPENSVLHFDRSCERMFFSNIEIGNYRENIIIDSKYDYDTEPWELGNGYWIITEDGLRESAKDVLKQK